jgi:catechol 2,3-dioxygenase-like lactoylglutathione lyase family enzyme
MVRRRRRSPATPCPDVTAAKAFSGDVLGLDVTEQNGILMLHQATRRHGHLLPTADHTLATYTIRTFRARSRRHRSR